MYTVSLTEFFEVKNISLTLGMVMSYELIFDGCEKNLILMVNIWKTLDFLIKDTTWYRIMMYLDERGIKFFKKY